MKKLIWTIKNAPKDWYFTIFCKKKSGYYFTVTPERPEGAEKVYEKLVGEIWNDLAVGLTAILIILTLILITIWTIIK